MRSFIPVVLSNLMTSCLSILAFDRKTSHRIATMEKSTRAPNTTAEKVPIERSQMRRLFSFQMTKSSNTSSRSQTSSPKRNFE
ncbi:hypothetical protein F5Y16DRAFT_392546 [Xylariaceae sp. FL0255]|nr:hypothetical protein F5Y16DRAFT_392546 [Xylariaceae sp. FL0255]